eukprot:jgi/Bigna1/38602/e_gw1.27.33.1
MVDSHVDFLRTLSEDDKRKLTAKRDAPALVRLFIHLALILTFALLIVWTRTTKSGLWALLLPPYGILLTFLFALSHECTHQTAFRRRWINDISGHAIAPIIALPFIWFRYFHRAHHMYTNDPTKDPEIVGSGRPETWPAFLLYLSGWGYWSGEATVLLNNAFGTISYPYLPNHKHAIVRREARVILGIYFALALSIGVCCFLFPEVGKASVSWLATLWIIPLLIGQPFLRLFLLAEHGRCPHVANMLENSRTTFTSGLVRALAWNMPYHSAHHCYPSVPFHQLPALHSRISSHLKTTSNGYLEFNKVYVAQLRH